MTFGATCALWTWYVSAKTQYVPPHAAAALYIGVYEGSLCIWFVKDLQKFFSPQALAPSTYVIAFMPDYLGHLPPMIDVLRTACAPSCELD